MIKAAGQAALILAQHLNKLLDAYDWYIARYHLEMTPSMEFELQDLQVSILALETIPHQISDLLNSWNKGVEPILSCIGFETSVLNEFNLHLRAVYDFMFRKGIELEDFHIQKVGQSFEALAFLNRVLSMPIKAA